jgi:hypothetical protein
MTKYALVTSIIIAIAIQNTCPEGWAGKTAFATCCMQKRVSHCHMREQTQSKQDGQSDTRHGITTAKQAFVLFISATDDTRRILDRAKRNISIYPVVLTEIYSDPLFRPPISCLFT